MKTALIDGDAIVYASGFASDQRFYTVGKSDFKYKKDALAFCEGTGINPDQIELSVVPEPLSFCLNTTKEMLNKIIQECGCESFIIYISGRENFRKSVGTFAPYKGNRDEGHKPFHYKEIRKYLIDHWNAKTVDHIEADDAMGIEQCKDFYTPSWDGASDNTIICSPDKDMNMIPGWHYNWKNNEKYYIYEFDALRTFYTQLLIGDPSDNIFGLYKVGPKTAEKLLENCTTEYDMWITVKNEYLKRGLNPNIVKKENTDDGQHKSSSGEGTDSSDHREVRNSKEDKVDKRGRYGSEDEILKWLHENANLLWIMRNEPEDDYLTWHEPIFEEVPF